MKKKLLFIGIRMDCAGTEKSFLSFLSALDPERYEIDLLLAQKAGLFTELIPDWVNVIELPEYGELFTMSGKNAASTLWRLFVRKNLLVGFEILPYFMQIILSKKRRTAAAERLWVHMMKKLPNFSEAAGISAEYDVAVAYWGDRTMFYMADKVQAKKKLAWLHFDYGNPPRNDRLYIEYFQKCDRIITVSNSVDRALREKLPEIADRCIMIENINNPEHIRSLAMRGDSFPDAQYRGERILTVGRLCEQKGTDIIIPTIKRLLEHNFDFRWYLIGTGDKDYVDHLKAAALDAGVADVLILLGTTVNPYAYIRDCDIYVQPSRYEGKPITVEEAKILCKPIAAANYLSASEQLSDGELGMIFEFGEEQLYKAVRRMLEDDRLRRKLSDRLATVKAGNSAEIEKFYAIIDE